METSLSPQLYDLIVNVISDNSTYKILTKYFKVLQSLYIHNVAYALFTKYSDEAIIRLSGYSYQPNMSYEQYDKRYDEQRDNHDFTTPHVTECNYQIIERLITVYRVNINTVDKRYGSTALMHASQNGLISVVKLLLTHGADPNIERDQPPKTAVDFAFNSRDIESTKVLINTSVELANRCGEYYCTLIGGNNNNDIKFEFVKLFLSAKIEVKHIVNVLTNAIAHNSELFDLLIQAGVDINAKNRNGTTVLISAVVYHHIESIKKLIRYGCKLNKRDNHGRTALIYASLSNCTDAIRLLIDAGAIVHINDYDHKSALYYAIKDKHTACAELLRCAGAK